MLNRRPQAFSRVVNSHPSVRSARAAELAARYCDIVIRRGRSPSGEDAESVLREFGKVMRYFDDRDVFLKFHSNLLARRLLGENSVAEDAENVAVEIIRVSAWRRRLCGSFLRALF